MGGENMANRKRPAQIVVRVTEEGQTLIERKMAQMGTKNFSAYARKMLIDGYVILVNTPQIKEHSAQLQKIGVNINQLTKWANETGGISAVDMEELKRLMAEVWKTERKLGHSLMRLEN